MPEITTKEALDTISRALSLQQAGIKLSRDGNIPEIHRIDLTLTTAQTINNPYIVQIPFTFLYIFDASDNNANINIKMGSNAASNQPLNFKKNSKFHYPLGLDKICIYWAAQSAKTMTILLFNSAEYDLQSQQITNLVTEGSSFAQATAVSCLITATILAATDTDRIVTTLYNNGSERIFIGNSAVTIANGMPLDPGQSVSIKNTAVIYGISTSVTNEVRILDEK